MATREELRDMIKKGEDIRYVDVSGITNMSFMFQEASSFNQDLSGWDVKDVGFEGFTFPT